jgi:hypothetical protein
MNAATLIGQAGLAQTIGWYTIAGIIIAGILGIGIVIARAVGVEIPHWFIQIFWIIVAVVLGVAAIKIILSLL